MSEDLSPGDDGIESLKEIQEKLLDENQEDVALIIGGYTTLYIGSALGPFLGQIGPGLIAAGTTLHNIVFGRKLKRIDDFHWELIKKLKRIINELRGKIEGLEERIREKVSNDDFEFLYIRTLESIASKQRSEKSELYRNVLINHLTDTDNNIDREEIYLGLLDEVSLLELQVLSLFPIENEEITNVYDYLKRIRLTCDEIVRRLPQYSTEDLFLTFKSLRNKDLTANVIYPAGIDKHSNEDLYLSDLGAMFLHYIKISKE